MGNEFYYSNSQFLIVDSSRLICRLFSEKLSVLGIDVFTAKDVAEALPIIAEKKINVVMVAADLEKITGLDLMLWLKLIYPAIRVVILSSNPNQKLINFINKSGAYYFHKETKDLQALEKLAKILLQNISLSSYGVKFIAKSLHLFDVFQLIKLAEKTCGIYLKDSLTQSEGLVCIDEGKIVHATYLDEIGTAALYKLLDLKQGQFKELGSVNCGAYTIHDSFNNLFAAYPQASDEPEPLPESDIRLLFVEDDIILSTVIKKHFQFAGFNIDVAQSAEEAIEKLKKNHYQLIITDFNLPNMSGLEFILWLQKNCYNAKLALMTGTLSDELRIFLQANGVIRFFHKPLNLQQLQAFINYIFSHHYFEGDLHNLNFQHILQVLSQRQEPVAMHILDLKNDLSGSLHLNHGLIESAVLGQLEGQDAIFEMMNIQEGLIVQTIYKAPMKANLNLPVRQLSASLDEELRKLYQQLPQPTSGIGELISADPNKIKRLLNPT